MCGIAGVWAPVSNLDDAVRAMTAQIPHRGPDADGHEVFPDVGLAFGHRRLSIVDLSPTGAQPMTSASGRYCITFNGEIYNFQSLRADLLSRGQRFRGTSDTEVLLAMFETHGVLRAVEQLAGMFAFAVFDKHTQSLWLGRDRMGEKPLYYGAFGKTFAFGSELKCLRVLDNFPTEIDPESVADVLARGCSRGARTIFRGVAKLLPGSCLHIVRNGGALNTTTHRYWSIESQLAAHPSAAERTFEESADHFDQLLSTVVREQMISDVPLGAFLSGGIDSSLVVAKMQQVSATPVRTFSIGFSESAFDESRFARKVAEHLGTVHTEILLEPERALTLVDRLPHMFDEPFADSSQLPTYLVCEATRAHVTVALSGDGGDELFGGYSQYHAPDSIAAAVKRVPAVCAPLVGAVVAAAPSALLQSMGATSTWMPNTRARVARLLRDRSDRMRYETLLSAVVDPSLLMRSDRVASTETWQVAWPATASSAEAQMAYDMQTYLPDDILVKVDRCAMAVSLETRAPLIDHRIVEFALREPLDRKIRNGVGKALLRNVLARYVPVDLFERPKQGFAVPVGTWLRGPLRSWAESLLLDETLVREWLTPGPVRALWAAHLRGEEHTERLWRVLMLLQFLQQSRSVPFARQRSA